MATTLQLEHLPSAIHVFCNGRDERLKGGVRNEEYRLMQDMSSNTHKGKDPTFSLKLIKVVIFSCFWVCAYLKRYFLTDWGYRTRGDGVIYCRKLEMPRI